MAFSLIHFLFIIFLPLCTFAQNNGTIAVGSSLTAGDGVTNRPWLSPSGEFGFGFKQLQDEDQFLLSIWYDKIPDKTVVWYAKVGSPVPRGSRVELTAQFGLVLRDPRGRQLWNTDRILNDIAYGVLNNTGNLVLVASDTTRSWESFKNPTDTLLPSQELEIGGMLISRRSETNFSQGRFYLRMLDNGNLVLNTKSVPSNSEFDDEYYNSDTSDATDASNSGSKVILDERGRAYILRRNGETRELAYSSRSIPPTSDYYHRVTLNFDGVLAQYSHPRTFSGNPNWTSIWSQPDNICININGQKGSGACGYNSICRLNSVQRPVCECPKGFTLLDPNDTYGSCRSSFTQSCDGALRGSAEDLYDFETLTDTDWPYSDLEQLAPSTEAECRNACLQDCFCAVAIYRSNSCWKKKLPLSNGRIDTSLNAKAFLKYQKRDAPLLDPIAVGSSLTAGEVVTNRPWLSPSGDFGFGFKQLETEDQFLLSIWYDKIPDKTVVWYANGGSPVARGSRVELTAQFGLVLRDPGGQSLWNTTSGIVNEVAYGLLNDTGNFVLVASNTRWLWESFKFPTDTLLPTQELEIGGMLISRRSETNFSQGRFYLRMLQNGNLVLNTKSRPTNRDFDAEYYNSATSDTANASNSGFKVLFDGEGFMYILKRNGERKKLDVRFRSILPTSEYYHRVTLNFDGVLTQYYYPRRVSGDSNWTFVWSEPENICLSIMADKGSGGCGYNSICRIGTARRPVCQCPRGYSLLDPNDTYGSCKPDFTQSCEGALQSSAEDLYDFETVPDTDWPTGDFEELQPSSEAECKSFCLHDCFCAAVIFREGGCWKKKLPMSNGIYNPELKVKTFLKYSKLDVSQRDHKPPVSEGPKTTNDRGTLILVVSVLLGSSVFINILFIGAACLGLFLIYQKKIMKYFPENNSMEINLRSFTFRELEQATNGFKEELGRGAFGIVYKGLTPKGSVAVKKLDRFAQDTEKEFRTEVNIIGQTHHRNLVRLIGFCDEGQNRLLVYEYMSNGTLASFLFGDLKSSWSQRTKIAQGVARGLAYLHEECITQIIHCDIKPQNILLDYYYNARISDFGLAKLLLINQSRTNTGIRGTKGYVAPEWFRNTPIDVKVDVYSFGVLLLEIITCRKSLENLENGGEERAILTDWAWDCYQEGRIDDLVGDDIEAMNDWKMLERFVKVGIWCIQEDPSRRPTMINVSQMLDGVVEVSKPPCPFPFSTR